MTDLRWPNLPPAGCPLERSSHLGGIVFTGRHASYTCMPAAARGDSAAGGARAVRRRRHPPRLEGKTA